MIFFFAITTSIFRRRQVAEHGTGTFLVVKINVTSNQIVLLLETWLFKTLQRVVQSLHLERPVEAFHRGIVMTVFWSKPRQRWIGHTNPAPTTNNPNTTVRSRNTARTLHPSPFYEATYLPETFG